MVPPYFRIKNWDRFQHYKERNPPWIKLHVEILSSEDWVTLADASKLLALVCMIVAAKHGGDVPNNPAYIKRVGYLDKAPNLKPLIECGFLINPQADASNPTATQADARPEKETDTEAEKERKVVSDKSDPHGVKASKRRTYPEQFEQFWRDYPTDPNMSKLKASEQWKRLAPEQHDAAIKAIPAFRAYCSDNAKTGYRPVHAERFLSQHRFDGFLSATATNGAGVGDPELARLQADAARRREEKQQHVSTTH